MPKGKPIEVDEVHRLLRAKADRLGRLKLLQKDLAEELGVTHFAINRLFRRMEDEGRMKRLVSHQGNIWTYAIRDPDDF